jgi:hypothetical protein
MCQFAFAGSVAVSGTDAQAIIENGLVKVVFDTNDGTYQAIDERDQSIGIANASFQLNDYASTDCDRFEYSQALVYDRLGKGKKLVVTGTKPGTPSLILEIGLYEDQSFISLNLGVDNLTGSDVRIIEFSPMKGNAFEGLQFDNYMTLDGECGSNRTRVESGDYRGSRNNLLITFGKTGQRKRSMVLGGLTYNEFTKHVSSQRDAGSLTVKLGAQDPVGKLVDAHGKYVLNDKFYVDFITDNRFEALEKYGRTLRAAVNVEISGVDYPIVNLWYCGHTLFGQGKLMNHSLGVVAEMEAIVETGFLKYSPVALRLEPDDYSFPNNQQGWWDDKHWQMYRSGGLRAPYDTMAKWGKKIHELGGIPFIYCQTAKRSNDYCLEHPEHMLFNDPLRLRKAGPIGHWAKENPENGKYWTYDFTDPGFIEHMEEVYRNLKNSGVKGIKFDYPFTGWPSEGGMEDKYATATSTYRNIYRLAYEGLGEGRDVQERIPPYGDIALGVITTQRTEGDNDRVYPARVTKTGLRWYKNRMVTNYDHDPVNPNHVYPKDSRDGWRTALTITYITSGRQELGRYISSMNNDTRHDLSRCLPLLPTPTVSPRPVDAFSGKLYPEIYDFKAGDSWRIVTMYNYAIENETWPPEHSAYRMRPAEKQFQPRKMLPKAIHVGLGAASDDGGLALDTDAYYYVFDFWNWKFIGKLSGDGRLEQALRPGEARVMAIHEVKMHPQFISTNRHIFQGYVDMHRLPAWDPKTKTLSGASKVIAEEPYKVIISANGRILGRCAAVGATCTVRPFDEQESLYELSLESAENKTVSWQIEFE